VAVLNEFLNMLFVVLQKFVSVELHPLALDPSFSHSSPFSDLPLTEAENRCIQGNGPFSAVARHVN
jgi:hypothetical protein